MSLLHLIHLTPNVIGALVVITVIAIYAAILNEDAKRRERKAGR